MKKHVFFVVSRPWLLGKRLWCLPYLVILWIVMKRIVTKIFPVTKVSWINGMFPQSNSVGIWLSLYCKNINFRDYLSPDVFSDFHNFLLVIPWSINHMSSCCTEVWLIWCHGFNSLAPGRFEWNCKYVIFNLIFVNWWLRCLLWNCPLVNGSHWWSVNIGSDNGSVPSVNKPLPEPVLTKFCVAIWHHQARMS